MIRLRERASDDEGGFGLIETVVALAIATSLFLALALAAIGSLRATLVSRQGQEAADLSEQTVEAVRGLGYDATQLSSADSTIATDSRIVQATQRYDAGAGAEPLVEGATAPGILNPHVTKLTRNGDAFTQSVYVTLVNDATGVYKRLTVVIDWTTAGTAHTRKLSTFVVDTVRGLPLPRFSITPTGGTSAIKGNGTQLVWGFKVTNLGARDGWNITAAPTTPVWTYYADTNRNGYLDTGEPLLTDTDANGQPDTGTLEPNTSLYVIAVRTLGASDNNTLQTTTFTAQSIAQPTATTGTKPVGPYQACVGSVACPTPSPTVSPTPSPTASPTSAPLPTPTATSSCSTACTSTRYYLRTNSTATVDFNTEPIEQLTLATPSRTTLTDYSKDVTGSGANGPGRYLAAGSSPTSTSAGLVGDWRFPTSSTPYTFNGVATFTFYARCQAAGSPTLQVYLGTSTGKTSSTDFTQLAVVSTTLTGCSTTGYTAYTATLPSTSWSVPANSYLTLKAVASSDLRVEFDNTSYQSFLALPQVTP